MSPESLGIDIYGFMEIQGAIACVVLGLVALWLVMWVMQNYTESKRWRRFAKVCGGERQAMNVVEAAEYTFGRG